MALYDPPHTSLSMAERVLLAAEQEPTKFGHKLQLEPEQVLNLVTLARYLRALPSSYRHFNMACYVDSRSNVTGYAGPLPANLCGTAACAVGHGPSAGIPAQPAESWDRYRFRVFGNAKRQYATLFSGFWDETDNTPHGAAARIAWWLDRPALSSLSPEDRSSSKLYADYKE